jgi:5-methylcytosine-specific restriction endonuclease McrA
METKKCTKCDNSQIITNFYKNCNQKGGLDSYCKQCRTDYNSTPDRQLKRKESVARFKNKNISMGRCTRCCNIAVPNRKMCLRHLLINALMLSLRQAKQKIDYSEICTTVSLLMKNIPSYCPYTGEPLIPGDNLVIDHKHPKSKKGSVLGIDNLQLVGKVYNHAKGTMTDSEFARHWKLTWIP